jgi:tetratricopeptide (TPR) repeat protein
MSRTVSGRVVVLGMAAAAGLCAVAYLSIPWNRLRAAVNQAFGSPARALAPGLPPLPEFPLQSMEPDVRRQFADAIERLGAEPASAAGNAALGTLYLAYRLPALAEPCLARAAAIEPANVEHRYLLGVARFEEGRFELALADFEKVLAKRPRETAVMLYRAESLRRLGRLEEAAAGFAAVIERDPRSARARFGAGQVELRLGRPDRARVCFEEALNLEPKYGPARYALGQALRSLGRMDEAQAQLARAEKQPAEPPADEALDKRLAALRTGAVESKNRGIEMARAGRFDEAIALFEQALRSDPGLAEAQAQLGAALLALGRDQEAAAALERAVGLDPGFADAHYNLGLLAHRQGRIEDAVARFEQAVALRPDHFEALLALGTDLPQIGRASEAMARLLQAAAAVPTDNPRAAKKLAARLVEAGQLQAAASVLRACVRRVPGDASVADRLAWLLATSPDAAVRHPEESLALAEEVCRRTGGQEPLALDTRAAALAALGRWPEAIETARQARTLAESQGEADLAARIGGHLDAYEAGRPWLEP